MHYEGDLSMTPPLNLLPADAKHVYRPCVLILIVYSDYLLLLDENRDGIFIMW